MLNEATFAFRRHAMLGVFRLKFRRYADRGRPLCLILLGFLASCTNSSDVGGSDTMLTGNYSLIEIDDKRLPADLGSIPTKDGQPGSCRMLVDTGSLSLNGGEFRIQYEVREPCTGSVISSDAGAVGSFEQHGTTLNLRADLGGGLYETYQASIKPTTIEIPTPLHDYVFRR
jgi:hypothetical protein